MERFSFSFTQTTESCREGGKAVMSPARVAGNMVSGGGRAVKHGLSEFPAHFNSKEVPFFFQPPFENVRS